MKKHETLFLLFALILGILIPFSPLFFISLSLLFFGYVFSYQKSLRYFLLFVLCFCIGILRTLFFLSVFEKTSQEIQSHTEVSGYVCEYPEISSSFQRISFCVVSPVKAKIQVTLPRFVSLKKTAFVFQGEIFPPSSQISSLFFGRGYHGSMEFPEILSHTEASNTVFLTMFAFKNFLFSRGENLYSSRNFSFIKALLFGDTSSLSFEDKELLKVSGISHIVSVSGTHLAFISAFLFFFFSSVPGKSMIVWILLFLYSALIGAKASILRAFFMGSIALLASVTGRTKSLSLSFFLALAVLSFFSPFFLRYHIGFLLSFSALAGILVFSSKFPRISVLPRFVQDVFFVSLSAYIGTFPVLFFFLGYTPSLFTLFINTVVLPFVPVLMFFSFLSFLPLPGISFLSVKISEILIFWLFSFLEFMSSS